LFHLSLPVERFEECLAFYRSCFGCEIVELAPGVANVFGFGAQITLHDKPASPLAAAREELHFGPVVSRADWLRIRDRLVETGHDLLKCVEPDPYSGRRGKLLVADPSGNLVEVNSGPE
jgi:extradiol dioxygenase family protein